jgi:hypothetical protein
MLHVGVKVNHLLDQRHRQRELLSGLFDVVLQSPISAALGLVVGVVQEFSNS